MKALVTGTIEGIAVFETDVKVARPDEWKDLLTRDVDVAEWIVVVKLGELEVAGRETVRDIVCREGKWGDGSCHDGKAGKAWNSIEDGGRLDGEG